MHHAISWSKKNPCYKKSIATETKILFNDDKMSNRLMQKFMHINRSTCMTSKQRFSCVGINEYSVRLKRFAFMWSISLKRFASTKRFASAFRFSDPFCINRVFPLAGPRHESAPWRRYMVAFRASGAQATSLDTLRQRFYCPSGVLRVLQRRAAL